MYSKDEENKYKNIIDELKNLKKIDAPFGIEKKIWNRINASDNAERKSVWGKLSVRMVPAITVLATVVLLFVVIENNAYEYQDPFSVEPEQRTDLIEFSEKEQNLIESDEVPETKSVQPEKPREEKPSVVFRRKEDSAPKASSIEHNIAGRSESSVKDDSIKADSLAVTSSAAAEVSGHEENLPSAEMKQGLNFRQVQLSEKEKQEVNELKSRIMKENRTKSD